MDTQRILRQLYVHPLGGPRRWWRDTRDRLMRWVRAKSYGLAVAAILVAAWIVGHIHYYNRLILLECEIHEARAQIGVQEQRRYHVRHALVNVVREYSRYEGTLLKSITELRTATGLGQLGNAEHPTLPPAFTTPPTAPLPSGVDTKELLAQLKVVAEQYPELKLSQNLQQLSTAVIESETEIAKRIMAYNDAVNAYTSILDTFPANVFAKMSGFRNYEFYDVDPKKTPYQEVSF